MRLFALLLASTLTVMAGATLAPALPALARHFDPAGENAVLVRLILTIPALATALAAPLAGFLLDRFGRKPPLLGFIALYVVAGSSGLYLSSLGAILAGRALLGIGVAGVMTGCLSLITDLYDGTERNRVLGVQSAFAAGGAVVYLSLGGALADLSWRAPFAVYLSAVPIALLLWAFVPETLDDERRAADAAERAAGPVPPRELRVLAALCVVMFLGMTSFYAVPVQLPFLLQEFEGVNASQTGFALAGMTLAGAIGALLFRRVRTRLSTAGVHALTFLSLAVGFAVFWWAPRPLVVVVGLVVVGLGTGMLGPNTTVRASLRMPARTRGRAMGAIATSAFLGQFTSPAITQPLADRVGLAGMFGVLGAASGVLTVGFVLLALRAPATATLTDPVPAPDDAPPPPSPVDDPAAPTR